ncbi:hypothetical protein [Pandoraea sp. ISTKB]|uniref:hypothetical protein n=1 Tax=Pandoraea sp. ISTKB TaxID=1586708 RepID=UPI001112D2A7|nr:hypothetical protein [Pandoraea sp. ISTKB]
MKMEIARPFRLLVDAVELDERVPSMRVVVEVEADQFGHRFRYSGSLWLECSAWDDFLVGLDGKGEKSSTLVDMRGVFQLELIASSTGHRLAWKFDRRGVDGSSMDIKYEASMDEDVLAHVLEQFEQFDRWWSK